MPDTVEQKEFTQRAIQSFEATIGTISGAHQAEDIIDMLKDLEERHVESWWDTTLRDRHRSKQAQLGIRS